jgi:dTDP-4-dehydrorhamnose reductase
MLSAHGKLTATDRSKSNAATAKWMELDISNWNRLEDLLNRTRPGLIVNTAAYTAVDRAETERDTAYVVNAELPARLAFWAKNNDARLLHYSTDYVFDGRTSRPYVETDPASPLSVYGASKLAGERALEDAGCDHVILRTSWVYSSLGKNFVLSMLDLARRGVSLKIVDDQRGCPTWAGNLARASVAVIEAWRTGKAAGSGSVFHYCDDLAMSWNEFARKIFGLAVDAGLLNGLPSQVAIPSSEFPQDADRPKFSVLDTGRIMEVFGVQPASFERSLRTVIDEIKTRAK